MNENELIQFLDEQEIKYQRFDHPAVYTCEQSNFFLPNAPGAKTKNLLLCDERKEHWFFLMFLDHKKLDFKSLAKTLGVGKLRFAPPEDMQKILGIEPGSVTVFALANDKDGRTEVLLDCELWEYEEWHAHPLVNTATLVVASRGVEKFLNLTTHPYKVIDIPVKEETGS